MLAWRWTPDAFTVTHTHTQNSRQLVTMSINTHTHTHCHVTKKLKPNWEIYYLSYNIGPLNLSSANYRFSHPHDTHRTW